MIFSVIFVHEYCTLYIAEPTSGSIFHGPTLACFLSLTADTNTELSRTHNVNTHTHNFAIINEPYMSALISSQLCVSNDIRIGITLGHFATKLNPCHTEFAQTVLAYAGNEQKHRYNPAPVLFNTCNIISGCVSILNFTSNPKPFAFVILLP